MRTLPRGMVRSTSAEKGSSRSICTEAGMGVAYDGATELGNAVGGRVADCVGLHTDEFECTSAAARASLCATKSFDVGLHKCRLADWDSSKRFAIAGGLGKPWPRGAHCCVGAAVVGVEDGTAVGARVGAVVVGLRMRTSAGAVHARSRSRGEQLSASCVLSAARRI